MIDEKKRLGIDEDLRVPCCHDKATGVKLGCCICSMEDKPKVEDLLCGCEDCNGKTMEECDKPKVEDLYCNCEDCKELKPKIDSKTFAAAIQSYLKLWGPSDLLDCIASNIDMLEDSGDIFTKGLGSKIRKVVTDQNLEDYEVQFSSCPNCGVAVPQVEKGTAQAEYEARLCSSCYVPF